MGRRLRTVAVNAVFFAIGIAPAVAAANLPKNWIVAGDHAQSYAATVQDKTLRLSGRPNATGFGTAMQVISAAHYAGKRVRFSADVESIDVRGWAGLWMRVDGADKRVLAFDNMQNRPIKGTTNWSRYSIVLPVDASAKDIAFGILLSGGGGISVRDLRFEVVSSDVTVTSQSVTLPDEPNLDLSPPQ